MLEAWIAAGAADRRARSPTGWRSMSPRSRRTPMCARSWPWTRPRDGRWLAVARGNEVGLYGEREPRARTPDGRSASSPARSPPSISPGTASAWSPPRASRGWGAWRRSGTSPTARSSARSRAIAISFTTRSSLPTATGLATCGYDKKIEIWDALSGKPLRTLEGHTGAVYDVAFSPDSRFLVSASADDTCKVWRVDDGQRMDTLPQPLKAEYTCAFSPDGRSIVAAGADNNIRVWRFVSREKPEINPMVTARFAHEGAIVRLAFTRDGDKARLAGRRSDHQGLAHERLQRAQALGKSARRADGARCCR